jgi:hypothetical protein
MVSKKIVCLIPALAFLSFNTPSVQAQTTKNFDIEYSTLTEISDLASQPGFVRATITGTSTAPGAFGLDSFVSNTYGRLEPTGDPSLIRYTFNSEPTALGLPSNLESFSDRYFGGSNELFGKADDRAEINLAAGTIQGGGTITIFDGTGVFENATGQITFSQQDRLGPPGTPALGLAKLNFQIQTPTRQVPEYTPTYTLISTALIGAVLFKKLKRRN